MVERWWDDLRLAWRGLSRAKGLATGAVLTLAMGIAGATAMFALVQGVLLRPLPVRDQERLFVAWQDLGGPTGGHWPFRRADVDVLERETRLLEGVAGVTYNGASPGVVLEDGDASYVSGASVTGNFFHVLGVAPLLGRGLTREDDTTGAEPVLVLTHRLWQRRYGGSPDAIGRRMVISEQSFRVVGVMPADVEFPRGVEMWSTIAADTAILGNPAFRIDVDLVARRRPGVTAQQALSELQALTARLEKTPLSGAPSAPRVVGRSYEALVVGDVRTPMLVLFGAVGLVLLIASANVANLLLLRGEVRRTELAVRAALGASGRRLARQLLAESALLAIAAAAVALVVTTWTLQAFVARIPGGLPRVDSVRIDGGVVLFATSVAFLTAALAGLAPVYSVARIDLAGQLRSGARGVTRHAVRGGRRGLVIAQVALAVTVIAGAGLLVRSLLRLLSVDMGLAADRLVVVELALPPAKYADRVRHLQFLEDVVQRLESAGPIRAATPVNAAPFAGTGGWDALITAEGQSLEESEANPLLDFEAIHPGYFETVGMTLVRGRGFTRADRDGPLVAVVSEDVAQRIWPGEDPIGKRLRLGRVHSTEPWRTVVGVAGRARYRELVEPRPALYLPAEQFIVAAQRLLLRTNSPLALVTETVRNRVRAVDEDVRVMRMAPFAELLEGPLARPRFAAFLILRFGIVALLLAAIGLYAVMGASVRQRDREMGVRVALGATASDVRRLVLGEGLRLAGAGAVIGLGLAAAASRLLRGLLFEVQPLDPLSMLSSALVLVAVSAVACAVPARRAARVDPVTSLRSN